MDALAQLATLAAWQALPDDDRATALTALAEQLGAGWRAGRVRVGRQGLGELVHEGVGVGFVAVPGGWLRMGLSCDDLFVASAARADGGAKQTWGRQPAAARPTRWVRVRPHLVAIAGLPPEGAAKGSDGGHASKTYRDAVDAQLEERADGPSAQDLVDAYDGTSAPADGGGEPAMRIVTPDQVAALIPPGFRLISEAELEWAFREGGATRWIGVAPGEVVTAANRRTLLLGDLVNGFGLLGFRDLQNLCADGAVNYDPESPIDQDARATDRDARIARWAHTFWQSDDEEMLGVLAGGRAAPDEFGESILRLACDLPGAAGPAGDPPEPLAEHAQTLAGLRGDARAQGDALSALGYLARGPGDDVAATVEAVLPLLPEVAVDTRVDLLIWLADVQTGGHRDQTVAPPERRRRDALREDRAAVRAAVAAASDELAQLLDDPEPRVRSAAALALTFCVDASATAKAALGARLGREPEVGVQAGLILALIRLGAGFRAPAPEPLIRAALTIATALEGPPNLPELIAAMKLPSEPLLAYNFGDLGAVAVGLMRTFEPEVQHELAPDVAAWAAESADAQLAAVALELAFGPSPKTPTPPRLLEDLTRAERQVLSRLADATCAARLGWRDHGLPLTMTGRRRYLGLDEPGPSDRFVPHGDSEAPLWHVLRTITAAEGPKAGAAAALALTSSWSAGDRLAVFLDRHAHGIGGMFNGWKLDELLAAAAADPEAQAAIDAVAALPASEPRGGDFVRALAATRPGPLAPELLREVPAGEFGDDADVLRAFAPAVIEAHALTLVAPVLARALAADTWVTGIHKDLARWAGALAVAPSPRLARQLLLLGWASGQPAAVRAAVGEAAGAEAALAPLLEEFDLLPQFTSWPRAREVLPTYAL
ncbi:MAG: hypothetical protein IPL61_36725 [Myxococcales bacterium]|nr:hypothetical protein [Myxococcales bacterium]